MVSKKYNWYLYWFRFLMRTKLNYFWKSLGMRFSRLEFLEHENVNKTIKEMLRSKDPFMVCRIGANESFSLRTFEFHHYKNFKIALEQLCVCAGFFPMDELAGMKFMDLMKSAIGDADICGTLLNPFDDYFLNTYASNSAKTMFLSHADPTGFDKPWTCELRDKKVLVVHPFQKTIESQYEKRKLLFGNSDMLPDFHLLTYPAIQTSAGQEDNRFKTWFEALDYMSDEIETLDFDIALIACGAYGLPLASRIKRMGKQAVHIGGSLQLLFGIKGRRWDTNPEAQEMYNSYWVYPSADETPKGSSLVEGSCYWK